MHQQASNTVGAVPSHCFNVVTRLQSFTQRGWGLEGKQLVNIFSSNRSMKEGLSKRVKSRFYFELVE